MRFRLGPIDLVIGAGERIALVGANGAGKTTLLDAVLGRADLAAGTVTARSERRDRRGRAGS